MTTIGIDVGGTTTRIAAVDSAGRPLASHRTSTPADPGEFFNLLSRAALRLSKEAASQRGEHVERVGLAVPGLLDRDRSAVRRSVALPWLEGRAVAAEFTGVSGLPCVLLTDAEAATWGEYAAKSPAPTRFVHLRVGTGIACGAVLDGELQRLDLDRTTHLELLVVDDGPEARPCACGLRGCLETIASGRALAELAHRAAFADRPDFADHTASVLPPLPRGERGGFHPPLPKGDRGGSHPPVPKGDRGWFHPPLPRGEQGGSQPPLTRGKQGGSQRPLARGEEGGFRYTNDENALAGLNDAWQRGDEIATAIVQRAADALVQAYGNLAVAFRPNVVCVGGGVTEALPGLFPMTARLFCARTWTTPGVPDISIEPARLGDDAGLLGAALLAR